MTKRIFPVEIDVENLKGRDYFQRGRYHFLIYNLDGSIKGANSGLYFPPISYIRELEFFIYYKNKWVNLHKNLKKVRIETFETSHFFEIGDLKIKLDIFLTDNNPALRYFIEANKKVKFKIKPVIEFNFVHGYHKNPIKGYCFRKEKGRIICESNYDQKIVLVIDASERLGIEGKSKINFLNFNMKKGFVNFVCSEKSEREALNVFKNLRKDTKALKKERCDMHIFDNVVLKSDNLVLNEAFEFAKYNIFLSRHRQPGIGRGFLAGVPYFLSYFGRDTFWSISSSLLLGDYENVRDCLNMFARYQSELKTESKMPGKIPHEIWLDGEPNYYSTDSSMLFICSLYNYYRYTLDKEYLKKIFLTLNKSVDYVLGSLENGKINHGKLGFLKDTTWMDSYNRGGTAVEMQALVVKSLECAVNCAKVVGAKKLASKWKKEMNNAKNVLNKFIKNGFVVDHINNNGSESKSITASPLFLLALDLVDKKKGREIINFLDKKGLFSDYGVRSRAKFSQGYNPDSYHKGGIWPFLSGVYLLGLGKYGLEGGEKMIEIFLRYYKDFSYGLSPEYIHGNKFYLDRLKHRSCYLQLWSSSVFVQAVLEGICGIEVEGGKLKVKPNLPNGVNWIELKNFRFKGNWYNLRIDGGKVGIKKVRGKRII